MTLIPAAPVPATEAARLQALHHYDILHSLQEDVFDEMVALSAYLYGLPVSYVALVDAEHLHYKATHGFALPPPQPRQEILCAQVVRQNAVVLYHDLAAAAPAPPDAVAVQQALAQQARFYAGAPLRMPGQQAIGTLCLVDQQPRSFSAQEQQVLEQLAGIVSQAVVLRHHCHHTPALGAAHWQEVRAQVRDEVHALATLVRYLLTRYGPTVPVPAEVLHLVERRLHDLHLLLRPAE